MRALQAHASRPYLLTRHAGLALKGALPAQKQPARDPAHAYQTESEGANQETGKRKTKSKNRTQDVEERNHSLQTAEWMPFILI